MKLILTPLIALLLFLNACSSSEDVYDVDRTLPADRLIKKLESNRRKIKYFEGSGMINVNAPDFQGKSNFEVIINKPDSIRISFYGPFGIDIAHVFIINKKFQFYDVMQEKIYTSSNDTDFLTRLFKIDFTLSELMNSLLGSVDLSERLNKDPDDYQTDKIYKLIYLDKVHAEKATYYVDKKEINLIGYMLEKINGDLLYEAEYKDFRNFDGVSLPYSMKISNKMKSQSLVIDYRKMNINGNPKSVRMNLPDNINYININ